MPGPERVGTCANVVLVAAAAAVVAVGAATERRIPDYRQLRQKARVNTSTVYAAALLLWVPIFDAVVRFNTGKSGYRLLGGGFAGVLFAFAWPIVLLATDLALARRRNRGSTAEEVRRSDEFKMSSNALIAAAWAMGTLLSVLNGRKQGHSSNSARILMLSLLLCIAFILPTPGGDLNARSLLNITLRAAQKTALYYAIGFFILGVMLAWGE